MNALPGLKDGKLKDLTPLAARPARASARSAQRRGRGDPARRRRGARSGAWRAGGRFRPHDHGDDRRGDPPLGAGGLQGRSDRRQAWHGDGHRRRAPDRDDDPARGCRDRRAVGQGHRSDATSPPTRGGATSPSTRCRLGPTARSTTRSAALTISRPDGCASSAKRKRGFARIICAFSGFSASRPDTPRAGSTATASRPRSAPATASRGCRANACAPNS